MKTYAALSMMVLVLGGIGCAANMQPAPLEPSHATARSVDVLLDSQPEQPFEVVTELKAVAIESTNAVEKMRAEAASQGLDGIYWIDCSCSGRCTAKGFVYTASDSADVAPRRVDPATVSMR